MIFYSVTKGAFTLPEGGILGGCYSGGGPKGLAEYRNNPAMEAAVALGPIVAGKFKIARAVPKGPGKTGVFVLHLIPDADTRAKMIAMGHDPDSFYIHGDNPEENFTASDGCIVAIRAHRVALDDLVAAGEDDLTTGA